MIFHAHVQRSRNEIERNLDDSEHEAAVSFNAKNVRGGLDNGAMTPVALGTILLWDLQRFGREWFDVAERAVNLRGHETE